MVATASDALSRTAPPSRRTRLSATTVLLFVVLAAVIAGWWLPTERYLTPQEGFGYALGITGGSLMLLLLVYPLRKRVPFLKFLGSVRSWFQWHMVLGLLGPLAILYHCNFHLGATNSNVALFCMLVVAGSGLIGRYLYARIHHGLYGRKTTLAELQSDAERLQAGSAAIRLMPQLVERVTAAEAYIGEPAGLFWRPLRAAFRAKSERRRLSRYIRLELARAAAASPAVASHRKGLSQAARRYVAERIEAARRVAEFEACEKLFALWHVLHMPLFFMLVIAGIVHVFAVHLY